MRDTGTSESARGKRVSANMSLEYKLVVKGWGAGRKGENWREALSVSDLGKSKCRIGMYVSQVYAVLYEESGTG